MKIVVSEEFPGRVSTAQIVNVVKGARKLQALVMERSPVFGGMLSALRVHFGILSDCYGATFELSLKGSDGAKLQSYTTDWRFTKLKKPQISPEGVVELFTSGMYPVWKMLEEAVQQEEAKLIEFTQAVAGRKKALELLR